MHFALIFVAIVSVTDHVMAGNSANTATLFSPCDSNSNCQVANSICHKDFSTCQKGMCMCANGYKAERNVACKKILPYDAPCDATKEVCDLSSNPSILCTGSPAKCACKTSRIYNDILKTCIWNHNKPIGATCSMDSTCYGGPGRVAECKDKVCACKANYIEENHLCRKPKYGEACSSDVGCETTADPEEAEKALVVACLSSGKCGCEDSSSYITYKRSDQVISYCQASYSGSKIANGDTCTASNMCSSGICQTCPGERTKQCAGNPCDPATETCDGANGLTINILYIVATFAAVLLL